MSTSFPIRCAQQSPCDDLRDALALLSLLDSYLDDGCMHGLSKDTVADMAVAFNMAKENIDTVADFLNADDREGTIELYRSVRRDRIAKSYGRAMA